MLSVIFGSTRRFFNYFTPEQVKLIALVLRLVAIDCRALRLLAAIKADVNLVPDLIRLCYAILDKIKDVEHVAISKVIIKLMECLEDLMAVAGADLFMYT